MRRNGRQPRRQWDWKPKPKRRRKPISDRDQAALLDVVLRTSGEQADSYRRDEDALLRIAIEDSDRKSNERKKLLIERDVLLKRLKELEGLL